MSSIEKMMILGVRAFPTDHGESIKFDKPLTLVAGINGSGKTTIIEALKFVTTGGLPPGAALKGAWIHDPGLQGEKEVMAQVKLLFHAANGTRLVVTRSMQLQLTKTARKQKTSECSLLLERHGQKTTLSTRVAELDQQVPLYLGVSQSLIENVIFCHQEDSQWPLAESSTLKKKFDEIFEAGKYTKAVKELLDIRKKHRQDLGRQEALADSAKKDRDRQRKVQKQSERIHAEMEDLRKQAHDLNEKMDTAQQQANECWKAAEEFSDILGKLEGYRIEANSKENTLNDLKTHLKEVAESDEWLENTLAEFDSTLARYEEDKRNKQEQWVEYEEELSDLKSRLDAKLTERGQFEQEKRAHEQHLETRRRRVKESASKHRVRGFDDLSDATKVEEFLFKIKKMSKERTGKLDQANREVDVQKREGQTQINKLTERQTALKDNRSNTNKQIALNNREAGQKQSEANTISADEGSVAVIESRIEELNGRLSAARSASSTADYASKIKQANIELASLEGEMSRLNNELVQGTKRAGEVAQLSHVKSELKEKERGLQTLSQAHGSRISRLISDDWDAGTLETQYKRVSGDAAKDVASAERERDGVVRESEQIQFKQKSLRGDLSSHKKQAQHHEDVVKKAIDDEASEFEEVLKSAEYRLETAREQAMARGGLEEWFKNVLEVAETKHACRLCERAYKSATDPALAKFKLKVERLIKKTDSEEVETELKEATEDHKRIVDASVSHENWKRLTSEEMPSLEQEITKLGKDHEKLLDQIEKHDQQVQDRQSAQKEIESISNIVASIVKTEQDIRALSAKAEDLSAKQSQHGSVKTLEDIQEEITTMSGRIQEAKKTLSRLTNEQDTSRSEMYAMELELRETKNELGTLSRQLDQKTSLLNRVEEYKAQNQKHREAIAKIDKELEEIIPKIDTANAKYEDLVQRSETQIRELTQESASLAEDVNALDLINESIHPYIDEGGEQRLTTAIREIERIRQDNAQVETAKTQLTKEIKKVDDHLRDSENTRRHYSDNLRYRQESRSLKWFRAEIEELESKNAEHDRDRLMAESQRKTKEHHNAAAQRQGVVGELKSKDVQLQEMLSEYNTDLKDAAKRYKEAHIKVESTKAAIEDIGKYSTALDQAVTKYHTLKMQQVNGIIDELWRATYQGSDVDAIYIKSDLEVKANTRSHNYRVVMLKRDVELDMRGRCSAGQKVLASIVIRLALAECFSKDCGVIALDEPTTNLDEKNIEALAGSLHAIIDSRRKQKNFQLIVITHDENFLRLMRCEEFVDHYWVVSRNNNDDSVIVKNNIGEIFHH
ncbi:DNA repair protein rad50 [Knufia fluminis]|uniref:DNA repair protein RAD50 n=1 Tax=Knufia fluminis TaxID=191047 RepID=A0AAN8E8A0_9EURO|nr:DNA repair protein rad50 [Knufia fluminis]